MAPHDSVTSDEEGVHPLAEAIERTMAEEFDRFRFGDRLSEQETPVTT